MSRNRSESGISNTHQESRLTDPKKQRFPGTLREDGLRLPRTKAETIDEDLEALDLAENNDEFNEDTFGQAAEDGLGGEFDFAAANSKINAVAGGKMTSRKTITLDELEAVVNEASTIPLTAPPGLSKQAEIIAIQNETSDFQKDTFDGLMTRREKDFIARIHLRQLTTDNPYIEDFYYQTYTKRSIKRHASATSPSLPPLYLPIPILSDRAAKRKDNQARTVDPNLATALGKISKSSSRKPRQQLQVVSSPKELSVHDALSSKDLHLRVLTSVENIYAAVLTVEDIMAEQRESSDYDILVHEERIESAKKNIKTALWLETEATEETNYCFVRFMRLSKGRKILGRALKLMNSHALSLFFDRLIANFEYIDVLRSEISSRDIEMFIHLVLSPLVPFIGKAHFKTVYSATEALLSKKTFLYIATNQAGIVLLCILLSRMEILKADLSDEQHDQWLALMLDLFRQIQDHLPSIFPQSTTSSFKSPASASASDFEFYCWQLVALIALNIEAEQKRILVLELREIILATVQHQHEGDEKALANVNVFLNAIGLDASQLT